MGGKIAHIWKLLARARKARFGQIGTKNVRSGHYARITHKFSLSIFIEGRTDAANPLRPFSDKRNIIARAGLAGKPN